MIRAAILCFFVFLSQSGYALQQRVRVENRSVTGVPLEIPVDSCGGDLLFSARVRTDSPRKGYTLYLAAPSDTLFVSVRASTVNDPVLDEEHTDFVLSDPHAQLASGKLGLQKFSTDPVYNTVRIERTGKGISVSAGRMETASVDFAKSAHPEFDGLITGVGILPQGGGQTLEIQAVQVAYTRSPERFLSTRLTPDGIADAASKGEPPCGFWHMLDFDLDDRYLRSGGDYSVAVVPAAQLPGGIPALDGVALSESAFAVVYCDGAVAGAPLWKYGMLKGLLLPTPVQGVWRVVWFDSKGERLDDNDGNLSSAIMEESGRVLLFNFPSRYSSFRMIRVR